MKLLHKSFLAAVVAVFCLLPTVQAQTLPLAGDVVEGKLPNGVRYVVRQNPYPESKVEFRLVMNVGSVLEQDAQIGMSHFLEHMIFNGSRDFPGGRAIEVFKEMGIKYGRDLNAFTDYDKTIYMVPVPTDNPQNVDVALQIMYQWVTALNLCAADIEKEKKIVVQEIRDAVPHDVFHDTKLAGSRYLDRYVLGTEQSVNSIDSISLRRYYDDWYRPELTTVIAVGDLDPRDMERRITEVFGGMQTRAANPLPRAHYSLPTTGEAEWQRVADEFQPSNRLEIIFPVQDVSSVTYADQRQLMAESLFRTLLSARLNAAGGNVAYQRDWYLSDIAHKVFELSAASDEEIGKKVYALGRALAQIERYGFDEREVADAKQKLIDRLSTKDHERSSQSICDDYIDLAVTGDRHISNSEKYRIWSENAASITAGELSRMVGPFFDRQQKIVLCYNCNPEKSSASDGKSFLAALRDGQADVPPPYVYVPETPREEEPEQDVAKFETGDMPSAHIVAERDYKQLGLTELTLSNGMRVALRPTPLAEGPEVMVTLVGRGGLSSLPDNALPYYQSTVSYVDIGGVKGLTHDSMSEIAYNNEVSVSVNIDNYFQKLYGVAFSGNVEELMKYLYLRITSTEVDREVFNESIASEIEGLDAGESWLYNQLQRDPFRVLQHRIADISGGINTDARELTTKEEIERQDLDAMLRFYRSLFGDPASLTAVVTGNFDPQTIREVLVRYLGALPTLNPAPAIKNKGRSFPQGVVRDSISDPDMTRSYVNVLFHGEYEQSLRNTILFKIMRDVLQTRVIGSLREGEGLVYSPYVSETYRAYPDSEYYFNVNYFCSPDNEAYLEEVLLGEITGLQQENIPEGELRGLKQSFRIAKREELDGSNTAGWRNKLREMYLENGSVDDFDRYDEILASITTAELREAFVRYFSKDRYYVITIVR
ncbi:insulinase family protein [Alistipes sp. OttesenSCG-928-B03]|nr:insulinase family protein [Alistipes sp. OttesenSCG-928-B03]